jgi:hypothetical protein
MDCANDNYNGSVQRMAEKWGKSVKGKTNLARANQLRFFKNVWLSNSSPHALVTNVIATDLDKKEAPMKLHPDIVKTGVKTVDELRKCLKSEEMYLNPAIYNLMCCGLYVFKYSPKLFSMTGSATQKLLSRLDWLDMALGVLGMRTTLTQSRSLGSHCVTKNIGSCL